MTILIDPPAWPGHGRLWSHLVSDVSLGELHTFARHLGVPERSFDADHYDLPAERHGAAVAAGAVPVTGRELLQRLRASGLRVPKRKGERLVTSCELDDGWLREFLASRLPYAERLPVGGQLVGGQLHLLDLASGTLTLASSIQQVPGGAAPLGYVRLRRGDEQRVTDAVYDVNPAAPVGDLGGLHGHALWPLICWVVTHRR